MRTPFIARFLAIAVVLTIGGCSKSSTPAAGSSSSSTPAAAPADSSSSPSNPGSSSGAASSQPSASNAAPAAPVAPPPPPPITIPSGTQLTIVLADAIDTKTANDGDRFSATLGAPITVGGNIVLPVGTRASGTVVTSHSAGKFNGNAVLALTLDTLRLGGNPYSIQTSEFEDAGKGRGKRTAVGAGGGAAFGAIVGALAGGGKGAAIGALAGGGAGTAGAAFTGKKDIVLPSETRLHFRLTAPVTVQNPQSVPPTQAQ
jgi:hypothetical protein